MMAGYLLARAGIDVTVLEKHADFLRDFRGDTIHPSTMDALAELGLLDAFLRLPHQKVRYAEIEIGGERARMADFGRLATRCKFIAFMPQWDFLDFLADEGRSLPAFHLMMDSVVTELVEEGGRVAGVKATSATGHTGTISDPAWSAVAITLSTRARGLRFTTDQRSATAVPADLSPAGDAFAVTYQPAQDAPAGT